MIFKRFKDYKTNLDSIRDYWLREPCQEWFFGPGINCKNIEQIDIEQFKLNANQRYLNEPEVLKFGNFNALKGLDVLEVGYGLGSDALLIAKKAKSYTGVDLSDISYKLTSRRFNLNSINNYNLSIGSSTDLKFSDNKFDFVYSWGVIHHSGDIKKSLEEIYRVLKKGGSSKIMVYNKDSLVVFIYWLIYSIKDLNFSRTRREIIANNIESPGTLILSKEELINLVKSVGFSLINIDLYRDFFYVLRKYPRYIRPLIRILAKAISFILGGEKKIGYFMCIEIIK